MKTKPCVELGRGHVIACDTGTGGHILAMTIFINITFDSNIMTRTK